MAQNYRPGTDARVDGFYTIPDDIPVPDGFERRPLPSVTTVLDLVQGFTYPERWWAACEYLELAQAAFEKKPWFIWHKKKKAMVEVLPGQVLLNMLPDDFGKNYGLHWMKNAGARELERRANRGQVVHDAVLDFVVRDVRLSIHDVADYTKSLIEGRGYSLQTAYCVKHVWNACAWLDRYLDEPKLCEAMVVNYTHGWAGTVDLVCTLRNREMLSAGVWLLQPGQTVQIDFKTSTKWYPEHRTQAVTYSHAEQIVHRGMDGSGSAEPFKQADHLLNVYVQEDKVEVMRWGSALDLYGRDDTLADSYTAFLHLLAAWYHNQRAMGMAPSSVRGLAMATPTAEYLDQYRNRHLLGGTDAIPNTLRVEPGGRLDPQRPLP